MDKPQAEPRRSNEEPACKYCTRVLVRYGGGGFTGSIYCSGPVYSGVIGPRSHGAPLLQRQGLPSGIMSGGIPEPGAAGSGSGGAGSFNSSLSFFENAVAL